MSLSCGHEAGPWERFDEATERERAVLHRPALEAKKLYDLTPSEFVELGHIIDTGRRWEWGRRCVEPTCHPEYRFTQTTCHDPADRLHPTRLSGSRDLD